MRELLVERSGSAPVDELAAITGIRSGHSTAPRDATLGRLLPDFHRPDQDEELGCDTVSGDLNGALRSINEPLIIDDKLAAAQCPARYGSGGRGRDHADCRASRAVADRDKRRAAFTRRHARHRRGHPKSSIPTTLTPHLHRVPVADRAAVDPGRGADALMGGVSAVAGDRITDVAGSPSGITAGWTTWSPWGRRNRPAPDGPPGRRSSPFPKAP